MGWDLSIASKQVVSGWEAEAARLRRFLDVLTEQIATQHAEPLRWGGHDMSHEEWGDVEAITAEILRRRLRSEDGKRLWPGGSSSGVIRGFFGGRA